MDIAWIGALCIGQSDVVSSVRGEGMSYHEAVMEQLIKADRTPWRKAYLE
jgi:hypothetical protein